MSPLEIGILLHYHCMAIDHEDAFNSPPAQAQAFSRFVREGYLVDKAVGGQIEKDSMAYVPTEKLRAYCNALCDMPEPIQVWVVGDRLYHTD